MKLPKLEDDKIRLVVSVASVTAALGVMATCFGLGIMYSEFQRKLTRIEQGVLSLEAMRDRLERSRRQDREEWR